MNHVVKQEMNYMVKQNNHLVQTAKFECDDFAIGAFKEILEPGLYNIYKYGRGSELIFVRSIYIPHEITEVCSKCESEITLNWDTETDGFVIYCPHCGNHMMLCDECMHTVLYDGEPHECDWCETKTGGKCHRGETVNNVSSIL